MAVLVYVTADFGDVPYCGAPHGDTGQTGIWPNGEPATVRDAGIADTRPSRLPVGCPFWCTWPDLHKEHDHYEDRTHCGPGVEVVLTAVSGQEVDDHPDVVRAYLLQHYREIGPRIELSRDDHPVDIQLTLEEAEEFAGKLLELVTVARTG